MATWKIQCDFSLDQLCKLANYAIGEEKWLITSAFSLLQNAKKPTVNMRNLEALGAINELIYRWQEHGPGKCYKVYGPMDVWGVKEEWLANAIWIPDPDHPAEPLDFEGFCSVFVGRLVIPGVAPVINDRDAQPMSQRLAALIDAELVRLGLGVRQGMARVMECYPIDDKDRRAMLEACIVGTKDYDSENLHTEMYALAQLISGLRELPAGSYGPKQLHAELMSNRSRT